MLRLRMPGRPYWMNTLRWFFERLKDRVPPEASEDDLDRMIRA